MSSSFSMDWAMGLSMSKLFVDTLDALADAK